jgi:hypothetical protein
VRGRTGDLAYVNVNVNVNVNGDLAYVMGRSGVTVEAVVSCVECVLVVGRQRSQGDIPPGRVCLKRRTIRDGLTAHGTRDREEAVSGLRALRA